MESVGSVRLARWLWEGHPREIGEVPTNSVRWYVSEILAPGESWEVAADGLESSDNLGMGHDGSVYFSDNSANKTYKTGVGGDLTVFRNEAGGGEFGPDGTAFFRQNSRQRILALGPDGSERTFAAEFASSDCVTTASGGMYVTECRERNVWFIDADGNRRIVNSEVGSPNGIAMSPDQALVMVADYRARWVWSFQVMPDGSLANGERYYHLQILDENSEVGPDGLAVDTEGFLYVVTKLGVQVCDAAGRVAGIINFPQGVRAGDVTFGGRDFDTLFVTAGRKVYRRKLRRQGTLPWKVASQA